MLFLVGIDRELRVGDPVSIAEMQAFVQSCVDVIHEYSGEMATVGSARSAWLQYWKGLDLDLYHSMFKFSVSC